MGTLIKTTQDGRRLEVVGLAITLGGRLETDEIVDVKQHPNRRAIRAVAPDATHMAGRVPLTQDEADVAFEALRQAQDALLASPSSIQERFRIAMMVKAREVGIE